jgi:hypothetical protein
MKKQITESHNLEKINKIIEKIKNTIIHICKLKNVVCDLGNRQKIEENIPLNFTKRFMESGYDICIDYNKFTFNELFQIINNELIKTDSFEISAIILALIIFVNCADMEFTKNLYYNNNISTIFLANISLKYNTDVFFGKNNELHINLKNILTKSIINYKGVYLLENYIIDDFIPNNNSLLNSCAFSVECEYNKKKVGTNNLILMFGMDKRILCINYYKLLYRLFSYKINSDLIALLCSFCIGDNFYNLYKNKNIRVHCVVRHHEYFFNNDNTFY